MRFVGPCGGNHSLLCRGSLPCLLLIRLIFFCAVACDADGIAKRETDPSHEEFVQVTPLPLHGQPRGVFASTLHAALGKIEPSDWQGFGLLLAAFSLYIYLALPSTPVEIAIGYLCGPLWGAVCGASSKTIVSIFAFLHGRNLCQRVGYEIPSQLKPKLASLKRQPYVTMISIRMAPLPLVLKNYGLALSNVAMGQYLLAALVVEVPFSILWASIGASCQSLSEALVFAGKPLSCSLWIGVACVILLACLMRDERRQLSQQKSLQRPTPSQPQWLNV